ncbi:MAG: hypothetical protein GY714_14250 [Desulfobacterales bacterium]|nr:hypothetical protein [Desulfobacterales bacterium]MCP4158547.1 hypothetical protein [Deltaproteobacteria bacterium]
MKYSYECPQCMSGNQDDQLSWVIIATLGFGLLIPTSCSNCSALVMPRWRNKPLFLVLAMLIIVPLYILLSIQGA